MNNIVSIFAFIFEFFIVFMVYSQIFVFKKGAVNSIVIGASLFAVGCLQFIFLNNAFLNTFIYMLLCLAWAIISFESNLKRSIIISIIMTVLMTLTEFVSMCILTMVLHIDFTQYASENVYYILFTSLSMITYLIFSLILTWVIKVLKIKDIKQSKSPAYTFIYPICALLTIFVYWIIATNHNMLKSEKYLIIISVSLTLFSVIATYAFYFYTSNKENELMELSLSMEKIKTEEEYYKLLDFQAGELKRLIHDEKNHLQVIKEISTESEVKNYISDILGDISYSDSAAWTENKFLDCILNKYSIQCKSLDIDFDMNIKTANLSFMNNTDLTVLISNLLDNAIRAADKSKKRKIELSINKTYGMAALTCANSCDEKPSVKGNNLLTTKSDSGFHGVGIKSIKRIVKKYNGEYSWRYNENDNRFITVIALDETSKS